MENHSRVPHSTLYQHLYKWCPNLNNWQILFYEISRQLIFLIRPSSPQSLKRGQWIPLTLPLTICKIMAPFLHLLSRHYIYSMQSHYVSECSLIPCFVPTLHPSSTCSIGSPFSKWSCAGATFPVLVKYMWPCGGIMYWHDIVTAGYDYLFDRNKMGNLTFWLAFVFANFPVLSLYCIFLSAFGL